MKNQLRLHSVINWVVLEQEDDDTYPKEGYTVLVTDGINYDTAWFLRSGEYIWKKSDVLNDVELEFNNFPITKWSYFE